VKNLKKKVDAGAEYIITQMFFDNASFFKFEKACRDAGITIPIIPGLKLLKSAGQLKSLPKAFHIDLPDLLVDEVMENPKHALEIGKKWLIDQSLELMEAGAPGVHYYVLNDASMVAEVVRKLQK
jgi:methylenetetrahydrofolate reductase (NADPH)